MVLEKIKPQHDVKVASDTQQIYILDDDESVLRSLKLLMVAYGFTVAIFSTAEEFFKAVPNSCEGCLILDIHMPGINGWDTQKRLNQERYKLPVIVISADQDDSFKPRAMAAGAVGFLLKPFDDHYLLHMVNRVFNQTI